MSEVQDDPDEEITIEESNGGTQQPSVYPSTRPAAFSTQGSNLYSMDNNLIGSVESTRNFNELLVEATLVGPPPPTVYAKRLVPFREKYKWVLRGGFGTVIVVIVVVLAITMPRAQRSRSMTSIALETSNQTSTKMLGVPQRTALDWILGPHNTHYDPIRDRNQIAQRYTLATLYYSTGGGNWTQNGDMLSKDNECNWHESVNCSQDGLVTMITLGEPFKTNVY